MHFKQYVWIHGSCLGSLKVSQQIEHSTILDSCFRASRDMDEAMATKHKHMSIYSNIMKSLLNENSLSLNVNNNNSVKLISKLNTSSSLV